MRKLLLLLVVAGIAVAGITATSLAASTKTVKATSSNRWSPSTLSVKKGDKIKFSWNNTGAPHDVRKTSGSGGSLTSNKIATKGTATFSVPSSAKKGKKFTFICSVHAGTMKLTATVK
jgi:plastocyanin